MGRLGTRLGAIGVLWLCGCSGPPPAPHSVSELLEDPALLQGIMVRCAADEWAAKKDVECTNARLAIEHIGNAEDSKHNGERGVAFQRQREQHREQEEQARRAVERAHPGFDPYTSPVAADKPAEPSKP
jgi:hypothetical protein